MNYLEFLTLAASEPNTPVRVEQIGSGLAAWDMHASCCLAWLGSLNSKVYTFYAGRISLFGNHYSAGRCSICKKPVTAPVVTETQQ